MNALVGDPTERVEDTLGNKEEELETDVEGVKADGYIEVGSNKFPKFDVDRESFFQNFQDGRRRLRWKPDTPVQKYMVGTKYRIPFYVSYKDDNGRVFTRKVK
jgi:hypothetical protein